MTSEPQIDHKSIGNAHFKEKRWEEAIDAYKDGLAALPPRKVPISSEKDPLKAEEEDVEQGDEPSHEDPVDPAPDASPESEPSPEALARSVFNANIGACHFQLGDWKAAVESCTEALADNPKYVKALQRRATCNEKVATWSSLTAAKEDYTLLQTLSPSKEIATSLKRVEKSVQEAQGRETKEMMDKLKSLGDRVLGNFGLSTDNFKFTPNGEGGYAMKFER